MALSSEWSGPTGLASSQPSWQTTTFYLKNSNLWFLIGVGWGDARKV